MAANAYAFGARNSLIKIDVDADNVLARQFTALERTQLPFAVMQAVNATAVEIRETWKRTAQRVFDRPTPLTMNAILYRKATKQRLYATIFIRNEAKNGTAPDKYLQPEVEGGQRRLKGMERLLQGAQLMPQNRYAVPGKGAELDAYGNIKAGVVRKIISQTRSGDVLLGSISNESDTSRARRLRRQAKRGERGGNYFVLAKRRGKLPPGIYERYTTGFGSGVKSIFVFVHTPRYTARYDIYGLAQRQWNTLMPFYFNRELAKALETSKLRGKA